jgi:hypothetical protein
MTIGGGKLTLPGATAAPLVSVVANGKMSEFQAQILQEQFGCSAVYFSIASCINRC